jgi:hypothetical protein
MPRLPRQATPRPAIGSVALLMSSGQDAMKLGGDCSGGLALATFESVSRL